jgi:hypothetical protein
MYTCHVQKLNVNMRSLLITNEKMYSSNIFFLEILIMMNIIYTIATSPGLDHIFIRLGRAPPTPSLPGLHVRTYVRTFG